MLKYNGAVLRHMKSVTLDVVRLNSSGRAPVVTYQYAKRRPRHYTTPTESFVQLHVCNVNLNPTLSICTKEEEIVTFSIAVEAIPCPFETAHIVVADASKLPYVIHEDLPLVLFLTVCADILRKPGIEHAVEVPVAVISRRSRIRMYRS